MDLLEIKLVIYNYYPFQQLSRKKFMLKNKKILIAGLANKHSIAAGIAQAMHDQGAELVPAIFFQDVEVDSLSL